MGGAGSGRWGWHSKRTTVEDCRTLTAHRLARDGVLAEGVGSGTIWWTDSLSGERTSALGYRREIDGDRGVLHLCYSVPARVSGRKDIDESILLSTTASAVGGRRWWFHCPLVVQGRLCRRRIGKLYLPPGSRYFGCRACHALTYTSCQESHRYDGVFNQLAVATGIDEHLVKRMLSPR